jgi:hypothetical protein
MRSKLVPDPRVLLRKLAPLPRVPRPPSSPDPVRDHVRASKLMSHLEVAEAAGTDWLLWFRSMAGIEPPARAKSGLLTECTILNASG